ncbi:unnamed protein product [Symbiodinium sp. CCMP2592]|nr:unnamed protein product [Symbiodinium sp. CCMP2592]
MRSIVLVLLAATAAAELRGRAKRQGRSIGCSCDCCNVAQRRPDERQGVVGVKCAPAEGHSREVCAEQCQTSPRDEVLGLVARDEVVDYARFCFYECKPPSGLTSALSSQCLALASDETKQVTDADGNPLDPAFLYEHQSVVALAEEGDETPDEDVETEESKESSPKLLANTTQSKSEDAENGEDSEELPDAESDPLVAASGARDAAWHAEGSAAKAARAARKALEALETGRNETWQNAMTEADKALSFMKQTDFRLATAHVKGPKPWRIQAAEAARAAAQPYLEAHTHLAETLPNLDRQASMQASKAAKDLQAKADELKTKAAVLRRRGKDTSAELTEQFASQTAQQAAEKEQAAKDWLAAAHSNEQKARDERYLENAQVAAQQAAQQLKLPQRYQPRGSNGCDQGCAASSHLIRFPDFRTSEVRSFALEGIRQAVIWARARSI